jgi:hypothetical protein
MIVGVAGTIEGYTGCIRKYCGPCPGDESPVAVDSKIALLQSQNARLPKFGILPC